MSVYFFDGFETGNADLWDVCTLATIASGSSGMNGYSLKFEASDSYLLKALPSAKSSIRMHFLLKPLVSNDDGATKFLHFLNGDNVIASLYISTDPLQFRFYTGAGSTLADSGSTSLTVNTAYRIELYYKSHASTGVFQIKINNSATLDINYSGDSCDTTDTFDAICFGRWDTNLWGDFELDDIVLADDDDNWLGCCKVGAIIPTGAGSSGQYTGSYADVDNVPPNDSVAIYTNTADQISLFTASNLSGSVDEVVGLQMSARARSQGPVTPKNAQLALRSGGTDYFSGNKAVGYGGTPEYITNLWLTDPATSAAWTTLGINNLEIGVKSIT